MADRENGTVKKWMDKGFGFIERDGMGDSIFVHARNTPGRQGLIPGSKVSFIYETDEKGGKAKDVVVEEMAEVVMLDEGPREMGTIKTWVAAKGFGFVGRANGEADAFFHKKSFGGYNEPYVGQAVSFVIEEGAKGAAATKVKEEEGGLPDEEEEEVVREMGKVKKWDAAKGFGFVQRWNGEEDVFFHKKSFPGSDEPYVGQAVSFVIEEGPKGAAAVKVKEEEGGFPEEEEEEVEREMGKVKTYDEAKGFTFIVRCVDATEIFGHKREFPKEVEPYVGQPVSFVYEITEKGGTAKKIREEDSVPDIPLSDEGRDFGTIKYFNTEKGFGFIVVRKGGEEVRFFEKALNEVSPVKNTCVSFVLEDGDKGALAKDLRTEDPERVARVTAKVHYGKVVIYKDPQPSKPDAGYGFIIELDQLNSKKPKKHYFHMSEIVDPDEDGGIDLDTMVSFIIIPAKKGFQAAAVTKVDPPKEEEAEQQIEAPWGGASSGDWGIGEQTEAPWGAVTEETHVNEAKDTTTDAASGGWGGGEHNEALWGTATEMHVNEANGDTTTGATSGGWASGEQTEAPWGAVTEETPVNEANDTTADATNDNWGNGDQDETPLETSLKEMHVSEANNATTTDATSGGWGSGGW